jgi:hypothetical protein
MILYRLYFFAKRQFRKKDLFLFWVAHAKLQRALKKKASLLINILGNETDEVKLIRKTKMKEIEETYVARRKSQPEEVPKYLKITEIDMTRETFKKVLMQNKVITE